MNYAGTYFYLLQVLRDRLYNAKAGWVRDQFGICFLARHHPAVEASFEHLGFHAHFPVRVPGWRPAAAESYERYLAEGLGEPYAQYMTASPEEMWSPDCPYGAARIALLEKVINHLEKQQ